MRIKTFSVTNFRSIITSNSINLGDLTVLVGKNNEGKSNLLAALSLSLKLMSYDSERRYSYRITELYDWERDFPISIQNRRNHTDTILKLEFELSDSEKLEFSEELNITLNSYIPITIKIGKMSRGESFSIDIPKRGSSSFKTKSKAIIHFISKRISLNDIPTIRTEKESIEVIRKVIREEMSKLYDEEHYRSALQTVHDYEQEVAKSLVEVINAPLKEFLPNMKSVEIILEPNRIRRVFRNDFDILIDDGVKTSIQQKGDGVKSLVSLALLKNRSTSTSSSIITIEEPESHLHPEAIHQLNEIIQGLKSDNQIILTTHNPLFVNRNYIKSNIIVGNNKVTPAKDINEIREVLGVLASDNLINSTFVLLVEGDNDKEILMKYFPTVSDSIKKALAINKFTIISMNGASNLSFHLKMLLDQICCIC